jgi:hypothetical protein
MKKILVSVILTISLLFLSGLISFANARSIRVKGYTRRSTGSYVQSYRRTSPNRNKWDNYSTKGNINPYTGKKGTVNPYNFRY